MEIAIVGAGMAGLRCATRAVAAGHRVRLFDKGRGPGGRMATRRLTAPALSGHGGEAAFDHGAQYITAKSDGFAAQLAAWEATDVVARWPAAGADAYVGTPAMNAPLKAMAAALDVTWGLEVRSVEPSGGGWLLPDVGERFDALVIAVPPEQAARLLAPAAPQLAELAGAVRSSACWTVMAAFAAPLSGAPDVLRSEGIIGWVARNSAKPVRTRAVEAWVVQAGPDWSAAHIEDAPETVTAALLTALAEQIGPLPAPLVSTAHRWRYAQSPGTGDGAIWDESARLGLCGDWLLGPRVEAAWTSGDRLAALIG